MASDYVKEWTDEIKLKPTTKRDEWFVERPTGDAEFIEVPKHEPPICCPDKPKALIPADRFKHGWRDGDLTCDPKQGGCGSGWSKND